ncbi:MAG: nickel-dependent lactate racemase family protein [Syntrophales bacterium]
MQNDMFESSCEVDIGNWKTLSMEYGPCQLAVRLPPDCDLISMRTIPVIASPGDAYREALSHPIGSPTLGEIIRAKGKPPAQLTAAISVSDITRPVPYKGENGLLFPLLSLMEAEGIARENIVLIIGNGMHRPSSPAERLEMYGEDVVARYRILDHDCENDALLSFIGESETGGNVFVNSVFFDADVKISTGLVESHFMAGFSGGRKGVCPGLVDRRTIQKFHGPGFLESPRAENMILQGNPCHEEALAVARKVGVDFIVNTTLDRDMRLTGAFAGHIEAAHEAATEMVRHYVSAPIEHEYDIVLTHGGYVGRNHYQAVKAAYNALPAVRKGGILIMATDNRDTEPIGGMEYQSLLHLLKMQGPENYLRMLEAPGWRFTKDQWEPEMWGKVFRKIGEKRFYYLTHAIPREKYSIIPGNSCFDLTENAIGENPADSVPQMVENALRCAVADYQRRGIKPSVAFIREGPYTIPTLVAEQAENR